MSRSILRVSVALFGLTSWPLLPAMAQPASGPADAETQSLIERLRPTEQQTRGIRMPGTDTGTASPPAAAMPTLVPAAPMPARPMADTPASPGATPAPTAMPAPLTPAVPSPMTPAPAPTARETTAPAGIAAVSITVNFASGSATLTPQAAAALASLGRALSSPELLPFRFRIEGHTDTVGDAAQNMALSQRRAEAVRDFLLTRHAVAPFRLFAVGLGETQLLVPTPDQANEPRNRRVQIVNLGG